MTYTIVRESGRTVVFENKTYWDVLDAIYSEYQSAGGNWDQPNILLKDGNILVEKAVAKIAWDYGKKLQEAVSAAKMAVRKEFS